MEGTSQVYASEIFILTKICFCGISPEGVGTICHATSIGKDAKQVRNINTCDHIQSNELSKRGMKGGFLCQNFEIQELRHLSLPGNSFLDLYLQG
jgi:hypothetical protein